MADGQAFCSKCGSSIVPGSAFCSKCGAPVAASQQIPQSQPSWREMRRAERAERYEKHEKSEKHEKGEKNEKNEKGSGGSMLGALIGGLVLIWLGATVYFQQIGYLGSDVWPGYFILGLGVILLADAFVRLAQGHRGYIGLAIAGAVLLFVGLTVIESSWQNFWPLILVVLGAAVIAGGLTGRRRSPTP